LLPPNVIASHKLEHSTLKIALGAEAPRVKNPSALL
jgi:hypothetical protein